VFVACLDLFLPARFSFLLVDAAPVSYADKPVNTPSSKKSVESSSKGGKGKGASKSKKGSKSGTFRSHYVGRSCACWIGHSSHRP
jgi:hypothetical protein